jgi:hypothetical protein
MLSYGSNSQIVWSFQSDVAFIFGTVNTTKNNDGDTEMKKITLAAAALLVAAGSAIAGSDHYGSNEVRQPATASDRMHTSSIRKTGKDAGVPKTVRKPIVPNDEYGQGIWGH